MDLHYIRRGAGRPLLLIHGIGGSWRSWDLVLDALAAERDVVVVDLPGHGQSAPLDGPHTVATLADALTAFLTRHHLLGIDAVGSSMGARLVLELARRGGVLGAVVSLDPGGFWQGWEVPFFYHSVALSQQLVKALQPALPLLTATAVGRTALLPQFSARPWAVPAPQALEELRTLGTTPVFAELLDNLAHGETQQGAPAGSLAAPLVIGWGRQDRVCLPSQAARALAKFPDARLVWFAHCGHFPQWDQPAATARLILAATSGQALTTADLAAVIPAAASVASPRQLLPRAAVVGGLLALLAGGAWWLARPRRTS